MAEGSGDLEDVGNEFEQSFQELTIEGEFYKSYHNFLKKLYNKLMTILII